MEIVNNSNKLWKRWWLKKRAFFERYQFWVLVWKILHWIGHILTGHLLFAKGALGLGRQCSTQQWVHTKTWQTMDTDGCASWDLIMVEPNYSRILYLWTGTSLLVTSKSTLTVFRIMRGHERTSVEWRKMWMVHQPGSQLRLSKTMLCLCFCSLLYTSVLFVVYSVSCIFFHIFVFFIGILLFKMAPMQKKKSIIKWQ